MSGNSARSFSNGTGNRVMTLYDKLDQKLSERAEAGLLKSERIIVSPQGSEIRIEAAPGAC